MAKSDFKWYTYFLIDPRNNKIFYIGKGAGQRIKEHEWQANRGVKSPKCDLIRDITQSGYKIIKQKVALFNCEDYAYMHEAYLFDVTDRSYLLNKDFDRVCMGKKSYLKYKETGIYPNLRRPTFHYALQNERIKMLAEKMIV